MVITIIMKKILLAVFTCAGCLNVAAQQTPSGIDTLDIGGMTIIRDESDTIILSEKKHIFKKLNSKIRPTLLKTEWLILDIGISNYIDNTTYPSSDAIAYAGSGVNEEWLHTKPFKSRNVNIWFVTQQANLLKHVINFKYGLGLELNNYRYNHPVRYTANTGAMSKPQIIRLDETPGRMYSKNKLAADYLTVPLMVNINFTPYSLYSFELSGGISVGYLYSSRNKSVTSDEGKRKERGDFDLRPWKLSYIGEARVGFVTFYGSYAFKSMYARGLDILPYTAGMRIRLAELANKLEPR